MQEIRLKVENYNYLKNRTLVSRSWQILSNFSKISIITSNIILFRKIKAFCAGLTWKWPLPLQKVTILSVGGCLWDLRCIIHTCMGYSEILPFSITAKITNFTVWAVIAIVLTSLVLVFVHKCTKIFLITFRWYFPVVTVKESFICCCKIF